MICAHRLFHGLVNCQCYLQGCFAHCPQPKVLLSPYLHAACHGALSLERRPNVNSKSGVIPPYSSPPPPMGAKQRVGQIAGVGMGDRHSVWAFPSWMNHWSLKTKTTTKKNPTTIFISHLSIFVEIFMCGLMSTKGK